MYKGQGPIRRSQLITPFGVGAMLVVKGGTSVISCGLDHWYERESGDASALDEGEFVVEEYRLQRLLDVHHFRLPPDFREPVRGASVPNNNLTTPFLRFPRWHVCSRCERMEELTLTDRSRARCSECEQHGKRVPLTQAIFVAMCDRGHLQDFPWREWVHYSANPTCHKPLRYSTTGGAMLAAQRVRCDCGLQRPLAGITQAAEESTYLSLNLERGEGEFLCRGQRPWLGTTEGETCERPLRGSLRGASNVWFSQVASAIYLPQGTAAASSDLVILLRQPGISGFINILTSTGTTITPALLRQQYKLQLEPYTDPQVEAALRIIKGVVATEEPREVTGESSDLAFRRAEFNVLRRDRDESTLLSKSAPLAKYEPEIARYFSKVMLIHKLRETRVFAGFTRIHPENEQELKERKQMLRRTLPEGEHDWLPASVVYGEGLFFELDEERLREWEVRNEAQLAQHLRPLIRNFESVRRARSLRDKSISPRFMLLHTLSHLLMNRLTFECGYSSAALRERVYISDLASSPMAGVLIYTADGDADGTMGGLVRMGRPGYLEPVIRRALESAAWCSADPVCREMGLQGPDSCNLAACHACALVPETSCEEFNRFLDRSLVVGSLSAPDFGFFSHI
ncbi:MAG: DrmB family protein [Pyrinomonadaceae bacterium]